MIGTIYIVSVNDKSYINCCFDYDEMRLFGEYANNPLGNTGTLYTAIKSTYEFGLDKICDFQCNNMTELRVECDRLKDIFLPTLEVKRTGYIYSANVINGGEIVYNKVGWCYDWEKRKSEIYQFNERDDELSQAIVSNEGVWDMELLQTIVCEEDDDYKLIEMTDIIDAGRRGIPITADNRYLWDEYVVSRGCWVGDD